MKRKAPLTDVQKQINQAYREAKIRAREMGVSHGSRTGARGEYVNGVWVPSQWEKACLKVLLWRHKAGEISEPTKEVVTYKLYTEDDTPIVEQIEIDFNFEDYGMKRFCRWDAKPPRVRHTKQGRSYPWKIHGDWFVRWDQLKIAQPDFDYRILEKGNTWRGIDL